MIARERIAELAAREEVRLEERTGASKALYERARGPLSGGVASSYQVREPWPIYIAARRRAEGLGRRRQRDVGLPQRLRVDGPGPRAPGDRAGGHRALRLGTHFAAPTEDAIVVGEELAVASGLPKWRYTNSGSESTMDAIRIARALTGRDTVLKIFGSYHGHHDTVMVSIGVEYDKIGDRTTPRLAALRRRHPAGRSTRSHDRGPFNDAESMERRIERWTPRAASRPA
jgi:glutamate-1-semialdehyde 2,1-aminomutase